ncbi:hypothetical protein HFN72_23495 [Rhizobium laguerreae]|uniref:hypothetical protein n=1 Tax=Rhizobium laguerreae TaxID=1076926 RepID=UPI001C90A7E7|nr:hypothetical protein [Rhizobium laguerreae]MBY3528894.1 hypothetical protein [Rhizobium laguerreae]
MKREWAFIGAVFLAANSVAAQESTLAAACQNVYSTSTANVSTERRRTAELEAVHDAMCSGESVREGFSLDAGMKVVVEAIPIGADLGINSTEARQAYLCKNYQGLRTATAAMDTYSRTIVVAALANFNGCIELASRGVSVQPAVAAPQSIVVKLSLSDPDGITLQAFSATPNMMCLSPQIEGKDKNIDPSKQYRFQSDFSIACQRKAEKGETGDIYKPGHINFSTSRSRYPFMFSLPEDQLLTPILASQSHTRIEELERHSATETARATKSESDLINYQSTVNGYVLKHISAVIGEHNPGGRGRHFGCGTKPSDVLALMCPGAIRTTFEEYGNDGGHKCGYGYYIGACLMPGPAN